MRRFLTLLTVSAVVGLLMVATTGTAFAGHDDPSGPGKGPSLVQPATGGIINALIAAGTNPGKPFTKGANATGGGTNIAEVRIGFFNPAVNEFAVANCIENEVCP